MQEVQSEYITMDKKNIKKTKSGKNNELAKPRLQKIVVNVGLGRMSQQPNFVEKILPEITKDFASITGQKPALTSSKKSIAGFKVRQGQVVGIKATLRRGRMRDFLERLVKIVLPRVKDFRGIDLKCVDHGGNLTIGLKENVVFPEINPEVLKFDFGLEISIVSNAKNREEAVELYRNLGIPLKKNG